MRVPRKTYTSGRIDDFEDRLIDIESDEDEVVGDPYNLCIDLSPVTKLYTIAFEDAVLHTHDDGVATPLGQHAGSKHRLVQILQWLTLFDAFQNGARASFEATAFSTYPRQPVWYVLAAEHGQHRCLVTEVSRGRPRRPIAMNKLSRPARDLEKNYQALISNSCVREPLERLIAWMSKVQVYRPYVDLRAKLPLRRVEASVAATLSKHYRRAGRKGIRCGGLVFDWYSANPGEADAFGSAFRYSKAL